MTYIETSPYPRIRLTRLSNLMARSISRRFQLCGFNITNNQEAILRNLRFHGAMSQTCLAEYTGQDRNSLSRTLAILEKNGLIEKRVSASDKRYCEVSVTPRGEEVHKELMEILERWRQTVFGQIPEEEMRQFVATSEKLMDILNRIDGESA